MKKQPLPNDLEQMSGEVIPTAHESAALDLTSLEGISGGTPVVADLDIKIKKYCPPSH